MRIFAVLAARAVIAGAVIAGAVIARADTSGRAARELVGTAGEIATSAKQHARTAAATIAPSMVLRQNTAQSP
jgi:hypothetical protein